MRPREKFSSPGVRNPSPIEAGRVRAWNPGDVRSKPGAEVRSEREKERAEALTRLRRGSERSLADVWESWARGSGGVLPVRLAIASVSERRCGADLINQLVRNGTQPLLL